ncbi:hypothetical protein ACLB2K_011921 [Fragaria x ananassa]
MMPSRREGPSNLELRIKRIALLDLPMGQKKQEQDDDNIPEVQHVDLLQEKLKRKGGEITDADVQVQVKRKRGEITDADVQVKRAREVPDDLPIHLIVEVLSWLPPDTYCRVKSLSSFFNTTLSEPRVVKPHPLVMVSTESEDDFWNGLFGVESSYAYGKGNLNRWFKFPQPPGNTMEIVGVCKGLVCAYIWDPHKPKPYRYVVFNPITSESLNLPCVSVKRPTIFGFGEVGGKLKVAVFNGEEQALLTLGCDRDWRISKRWDGDPCIGPRDGKYYKGCLHWVARRSRAIIVFHLGGEHFEEIGFPVAEKNLVVAVGTLGESLCVVVRCGFTMEIYTMGGQKFWEKKRDLLTNVDLYTRILSYSMHGRAERLVILHHKLGFVKKGRNHVKWCNMYADGEVVFRSAYIIEPNFHTLQQLGVYFDGGDIQSDDAGMSDDEDDEDDGYDLIW